jgi:hypothetical protein
MNERIQELAKQAGHRYYPSSNSGPLRVEYLTPELEKFAELIVRECVGVADDYVKDCTCDEHKNCKHPRSIIGRKIKEHFGVAE